MIRVLRKIARNEMVRYLFFGGCTTMVNLTVFYVLRYGALLSLKAANLTAILTAVLFAFAVNKWCVFGINGGGVRKAVREFVNFTGMRLVTMLIEFFGVGFLAEWAGVPDMISKVLIQAGVIALNYMFSKFWIFKDEKTTGGVANGSDISGDSMLE